METTVVNKITRSKINNREAIRFLSDEEWIENHGSGTLRKNKRICFSWRTQYLHERIAYEYGFIWECVPRTWLTFGDAITEADCHAVTEAGWHIERYMQHLAFPEDRVETKYINVEYKGRDKREGIGMILRETSAKFIPAGHIVFCIVAEFDTSKKDFFPNAINPF